MVVVISRRYEETQTMGGLFVFDRGALVLSVKSLELPWLNNRTSVSCISEGQYDCERIDHPRFGHCWWVKEVPGRTDILIHSGNIASTRNLSVRLIDIIIGWFAKWPKTPVKERKVDTEGCIMPGLRFADINGDGILDVADSGKAMNQLREVLPDNFKIIIT